MRQHNAWDEHAAFTDALAAEGFVVLGGPLGRGERVLHIVSAPTEEAIRARFALDPWEPMGLLSTATVEPWLIPLRAAVDRELFGRS